MSWADYWAMYLQLGLLLVILLLAGVVSALILNMHLTMIRSHKIEEKKNGTLKL